jgi:hypothetical protein
MTAADFRRLALALPEAVEAAHGRHPDFRVGGKIFATLGDPDEAWGVVKLAPEDQEMRLSEPAVFVPVAGIWGRRGWTRIRLKYADETTLRSALLAAWRNTAPKRLSNRGATGRE